MSTKPIANQATRTHVTVKSGSAVGDVPFNRMGEVILEIEKITPETATRIDPQTSKPADFNYLAVELLGKLPGEDDSKFRKIITTFPRRIYLNYNPGFDTISTQLSGEVAEETEDHIRYADPDEEIIFKNMAAFRSNVINTLFKRHEDLGKIINFYGTDSRGRKVPYSAEEIRETIAKMVKFIPNPSKNDDFYLVIKPGRKTNIRPGESKFFMKLTELEVTADGGYPTGKVKACNYDFDDLVDFKTEMEARVQVGVNVIAKSIGVSFHGKSALVSRTIAGSQVVFHEEGAKVLAEEYKDGGLESTSDVVAEYKRRKLQGETPEEAPPSSHDSIKLGEDNLPANMIIADHSNKAPE